jgi:pyrophosphatase PpaX
VVPELRALFEVVMAAEDSERHKPAPDPVLGALERLGAAPEGACYVGDSPFDIESGRTAGVVTIAVTWGFFSRDALEAVGPDRIVETPGELVRACLGERVG